MTTSDPSTAPAPSELEARLTELEIKSAFAEDLLERLNTLVARQEERIEVLVREIARLRDQIGSGDAAEPRRPADEIPPHY